MTDLQAKAMELCERWFDKGSRASWCPEMVNEFAQALRAEREACAQVAEHESELPGAMPEGMWEVIRNDRDATEEFMRIVVRKTKQGIAAAIRQGRT